MRFVTMNIALVSFGFLCVQQLYIRAICRSEAIHVFKNDLIIQELRYELAHLQRLHHDRSLKVDNDIVAARQELFGMYQDIVEDVRSVQFDVRWLSDSFQKEMQAFLFTVEATARNFELLQTAFVELNATKFIAEPKICIFKQPFNTETLFRNLLKK